MKLIRGPYVSPFTRRTRTDEQLPSSFIATPVISRLHHFSNGICRLKYITAREQGIILRVSRHRGCSQSP